MLAQDQTINNAGTTPFGAAVSEELRALFSHLEAELHRSQSYCRAIASLQAIAPTSAQALIQAVGWEALRLALQHFAPTVEQAAAAPAALSVDLAAKSAADLAAKSVPAVAQAVTHTAVLSVAQAAAQDADQDADQDAAQDAAQAAAQDAAMFSAIANVMAPTPRKSRFSFLPARAPQLTAAEIALQASQTREAQLRHLGQQLRQAREAQAMTLTQLHTRSFVPMYHLQALEIGRVEHLPEDVYLRGFLRRLENVLGLDVGTLQSNLPTAVAPTSIAPTWTQAKPAKARFGWGGLEVNSAHLYVTYAGLMAGGVFWLSHQTSPKANFNPITIDNPHTESASKDPNQVGNAAQSAGASNLANRAAKKSPSAKVSQQSSAGLKVSIAPPEMLRSARSPDGSVLK
jgi:cytoskeleton protein RodZ